MKGKRGGRLVRGQGGWGGGGTTEMCQWSVVVEHVLVLAHPGRYRLVVESHEAVGLLQPPRRERDMKVVYLGV